MCGGHSPPPVAALGGDTSARGRCHSRWRHCESYTRSMRVEMYCKRDCDCCEKAFKVLARYAYDYDLAITCTDITDNVALMARYGNQIPVVFIDGKLRFKGRVNEVLWRRLLVNAPARAAIS